MLYLLISFVNGKDVYKMLPNLDLDVLHHVQGLPTCWKHRGLTVDPHCEKWRDSPTKAQRRSLVEFPQGLHVNGHRKGGFSERSATTSREQRHLSGGLLQLLNVEGLQDLPEVLANASTSWTDLLFKSVLTFNKSARQRGSSFQLPQKAKFEPPRKGNLWMPDRSSRRLDQFGVQMAGWPAGRLVAWEISSFFVSPLGHCLARY